MGVEILKKRRRTLQRTSCEMRLGTQSQAQLSAVGDVPRPVGERIGLWRLARGIKCRQTTHYCPVDGADPIDPCCGSTRTICETRTRGSPVSREWLLKLVQMQGIQAKYKWRYKTTPLLAKETDSKPVQPRMAQLKECAT